MGYISLLKGKLFGLQNNYYIAEVEFREGEDPEEHLSKVVSRFFTTFRISCTFHILPILWSFMVGFLCIVFKEVC